jgi:hypothetical protein
VTVAAFDIRAQQALTALLTFLPDLMGFLVILLVATSSPASSRRS